MRNAFVSYSHRLAGGIQMILEENLKAGDISKLSAEGLDFCSQLC